MTPRVFCCACAQEVHGRPNQYLDMPIHMTCLYPNSNHRPRAHELDRLGIEHVPCETCGMPTDKTGTARCDGCWEVEHRLAAYLRLGPKAITFVRTMLAAEETLLGAEKDLRVLETHAKTKGVQ